MFKCWGGAVRILQESSLGHMLQGTSCRHRQLLSCESRTPIAGSIPQRKVENVFANRKMKYSDLFVLFLCALFS